MAKSDSFCVGGKIHMKYDKMTVSLYFIECKVLKKKKKKCAVSKSLIKYFKSNLKCYI